MSFGRLEGKFMIANPLLDSLPLMTARQQKFLYLALSRLGWEKNGRTGKSFRSDQPYFIEIETSEFKAIFGDRTRSSSTDLKKEVDELHRIIIKVKNTDYREFIDKNPECIKPLMEYLYDTGEIPPMEYLAKKEWSFPLINIIGIGHGKVIIQINKYATPFLCFVTSNFTESNIDVISRLSDKAEIHFYMSMKRFIIKNGIQRIYSHDEIRKLTLGADSKQYKDKKNFRNLFLKRIVDNINEHTDIHLAVEYKSGNYYVFAKSKGKSKNTPLKKIDPAQQQVLDDFINSCNENANRL